MEKDKKTINRCSECDLYKTPQKPCYWDNKKFAKECYPQMEKCPYAEK